MNRTVAILVTIAGCITSAHAGYAMGFAGGDDVTTTDVAVDSSQTKVEGTARTLDEVAIEAKRAKAVPDGISYIPTSKEKKSAASATYLLGLLRISSLNYDWATDIVTSRDGAAISYYINGQKAEDWEVKMIQPKDIRSVEVLRNPVDPKYHGERCVINYVVRVYEYGFYGVMNATQRVFQDNGLYDAGIKYTRGKWSVVASGSYMYTLSTENRTSQTVFDFNNGLPPVSRLQSSELYNRHEFGSAVVKVSYDTERYTIRNQIGFGIWHTPVDRDIALNDYGTDAEVASVSLSDTRRPSFSYSGGLDYRFANRKDYLFVSWMYGYNNNSGTRSYTTDNDAIQPIVTDSHDRMHTGSLSACFYHFLDNRHSLAGTLNVSENYNTTRYTGSNIYSQNTSITTLGCDLYYAFKQSEKWRHSASVKYTEKFIDAGIHGKTSYAGGAIQLNSSGAVADAHSIEVSASYSRTGLGASTFNSASISTSEIEGVSGNKSLVPSDNLDATASYMWFANNRIQLTGVLLYSGIFNDIQTWHYPHDGIMYSESANVGDYNSLNINLGVEYSILSGILSAGLSPFYMHQWHTEPIHVDKGMYGISVPLTYVSDFGLTATVQPTYMSPDSYEFSNGYFSKSNRPFHLNIIVSYVHDDLSLTLKALDLWYRDRTMTQSRTERYYSNTMSEVISRMGRYLSLTLRYTLNFGRKVRNESVHFDDTYKSGLL